MSGIIEKITILITALLLILPMASQAVADDTFIKLSCDPKSQAVTITIPYYDNRDRMMAGIADGTIKDMYSFGEKVKEWSQKPITCDLGQGEIISLFCWRNPSHLAAEYISIKLNTMEIPNQLMFYPYGEAAMKIHVLGPDEVETHMCPLHKDNTFDEGKCVDTHIKNGQKL